MQHVPVWSRAQRFFGSAIPSNILAFFEIQTAVVHLYEDQIKKTSSGYWYCCRKPKLEMPVSNILESPLALQDDYEEDESPAFSELVWKKPNDPQRHTIPGITAIYGSWQHFLLAFDPDLGPVEIDLSTGTVYIFHQLMYQNTVGMEYVNRQQFLLLSETSLELYSIEEAPPLPAFCDLPRKNVSLLSSIEFTSGEQVIIDRKHMVAGVVTSDIHQKRILHFFVIQQHLLSYFDGGTLQLKDEYWDDERNVWRKPFFRYEGTQLELLHKRSKFTLDRLHFVTQNFNWFSIQQKLFRVMSQKAKSNPSFVKTSRANLPQPPSYPQASMSKNQEEILWIGPDRQKWQFISHLHEEWGTIFQLAYINPQNQRIKIHLEPYSFLLNVYGTDRRPAMLGAAYELSPKEQLRRLHKSFYAKVLPDRRTALVLVPTGYGYIVNLQTGGSQTIIRNYRAYPGAPLKPQSLIEADSKVLDVHFLSNKRCIILCQNGFYAGVLNDDDSWLTLQGINPPLMIDENIVFWGKKDRKNYENIYPIPASTYYLTHIWGSNFREMELPMFWVPFLNLTAAVQRDKIYLFNKTYAFELYMSESAINFLLRDCNRNGHQNQPQHGWTGYHRKLTGQ